MPKAEEKEPEAESHQSVDQAMAERRSCESAGVMCRRAFAVMTR